MRSGVLSALVAITGAVALAEPIPVRQLEGPARGFVTMSDAAGRPLAHGELVQWLDGDEVASRLCIRFDDGSLHEERARFTQRDVFRLRRYRQRQHGPSFPEPSDVAFDASGRYRVRQRPDPKEPPVRASGRFEVPPDASNGITSLPLRNPPPGASATRSVVTFRPEPLVLALHLALEGTDRLLVGDEPRPATRFRVTPRVTGVKGLAATVVGKQPESLVLWIARGRAPGLVRARGPLYAGGPAWTVVPAGPRWGEELR